MNGLVTMSLCLFSRYKHQHGTVPRCACCGTHILVGDAVEPLNRRNNTKYLCGFHAQQPIVVYQITRRNRNNGNGMGRSFFLIKEVLRS
jgi:hypothetical protein